MSKNPNLETALVHELCVCCCKEVNHLIMMNSKLTEHYANQVKEMNGKAVGFADEPCEDCAKYINDGYVAMVGIDPTKSDPNKDGTVRLTNVYRTGKMMWVKREALNRWLNWDRTEPFILVENEVIDELRKQYEESYPQGTEETSQENAGN